MTHRWTIHGLKLSAAGFGVLATAAAFAALPTYRIELIAKGNGILPVSASGISDNGNVVGRGRLSGTNNFVAYLAKSGRPPVALKGSEGGPGAGEVNDAGQATGYHLRDEGSYLSVQGAMWTAAGEMHDLEELVGCDLGTPNDFSSPRGLNEAGDMVFYLYCVTNGMNVKGSVLWRQGVMTVLPTLGGDYNGASDINDHGQVTGSSEVEPEGYSVAYIWQDGVIKSLGTLGGPASSGSVINDLGHVAGTSVLANYRSRTFLYDGVTMRAMPLCDNSHPVSPTGLTNDDLIVGNYGGHQNPRTGVIGSGRCKSLLELLDSSGAGWSNLSSGGVNNHGVIVGSGLYQGKNRAFIATPISQTRR